MNLKLTKIYFSVQDYLMILFGTLLYGFGFNAFILSNEIVTGGVSDLLCLQWIDPGIRILFCHQRSLVGGSLKDPWSKILDKNYFRSFLTLGFSLSFRVAAERTTYTARPAVYGYHNRSVYVWCRTRIGILGQRQYRRYGYYRCGNQ